MTIHSLLSETIQLPGIRGAAVLDLATGVSLGARGEEELEAERLASDYARSLNATRRFLEPGADEDRVQELRIQTQNHHICFLPLSPSQADGLYLCLLLESEQAQSASFQEGIQRIREKFQAEGSLLSDTDADALYTHRV
jgi:hypothetical protein